MSRLEMKPNLFGVRHLSPGGAYHLVSFLDEIRPTAVLVEGLSDANSQMEYFTAPGTKLPIAVLAYTEELPVRTLLYPFAEYSPEYQAILWARRNGVHSEFIDLPSDVFLCMEHAEYKEENRERRDIYTEIARLEGEEDYDAYWERSFEHNLNKDSYRFSAFEFGKSLRALSDGSRFEYAKNLVREAYMRSRIRNAIDSGHSPDKIVVVTGAFHSPVLDLENGVMTDEEFASLPRVKTRLTLMPYSYYRLSSVSGYGAGNNAPAYYGLMWQCLKSNELEKLPAMYLSRVVSFLRNSGTPKSSAEIIEGVRLSNALASLHSGSAPTLRDIHDSAVTCLGHGDLSVVAEALAQTEIGTDIGSLPEGVSRTSIQDDFYRELKRLKLEKYKTPVAMDLDLDLRENRRVQSRESAFLDLNRSFFLNRLKVLNVSFQQLKGNSQDKATWAESWVLRWTPEAEIELVESTLRGETIELAAAYVFKERLDSSTRIDEASEIIMEACRCGMAEWMEQARLTLQRLAVESGAFLDISNAASDLATVISYGDIRKFDTSPLMPLLQQLFLRGALLLNDAANCDNNAARELIHAFHKMNLISLEYHTLVDEEVWIKRLAELSDRDDRNPRLSGYACAILLERGLVDTEKLAQEVSRRLSPGIEADLGAGWFEGLSMRNRYALLARINLWEQLAGYVEALDSEQFKRALVFLRRAFGDFGPAEKRTICENLGEIWGAGKDDTSDLLSRELSEDEEKEIENINEFDFGDL